MGPAPTTETTTKTLPSFPSQENQNKKKSDFLTFLKEIREKYKPDPDNNFYPEILEIKHENEIGVLKVDLKGHLYIRLENATIDINSVDAPKYWRLVYENQNRLIPLPG